MHICGWGLNGLMLLWLHLHRLNALNCNVAWFLSLSLQHLWRPDRPVSVLVKLWGTHKRAHLRAGNECDGAGRHSELRRWLLPNGFNHHEAPTVWIRDLTLRRDGRGRKQGPLLLLLLPEKHQPCASMYMHTAAARYSKTRPRQQPTPKHGTEGGTTRTPPPLASSSCSNCMHTRRRKLDPELAENWRPPCRL